MLRSYGEVQGWIADKVDLESGEIVVDAGTGPGALFAVFLAQIVGHTGLVVAIDNAESYVASIKKTIAEKNLGRVISLVLADLRHIPLKDDSVDAAVSLDTIQNMYGNGKDVGGVVAEFIAESARITKIGRSVAIGTRSTAPQNKAQDLYLKLHLFWIEVEHRLWGERARYFSESELCHLLGAAHLHAVQTRLLKHSTPYPRDYERSNLARIRGLVEEVRPRHVRQELKDEFDILVSEVLKYGEEFPPTLVAVATKCETTPGLNRSSPR